MTTILIVDDDKNLRRLYREELEAAGYRVLLEANDEVVCGFAPVEVARLPARGALTKANDTLEPFPLVVRAEAAGVIVSGAGSGTGATLGLKLVVAKT